MHRYRGENIVVGTGANVSAFSPVAPGEKGFSWATGEGGFFSKTGGIGDGNRAKRPQNWRPFSHGRYGR